MAVRLVPNGRDAAQERSELTPVADPAPPTPDPAPAEEAGPRADTVRLLADLDDRFSAVTRAVRRVRESADDEAVHDLRVSCRRMIAAGDVWRDALRRRPARALRRRLRRLRRRAGDVRDLEVHVERLRELRENLQGGPREMAAYVLGGLEPQAAQALMQIQRRMRARPLRRMADRYARATRDLRMNPAVTVSLLAARTEFSRRGLEARAALHAALESGHAELLHAARVAVKKWRYAAETLEAALPPESAAPDMTETERANTDATRDVAHEVSTAPIRVLRRLQQALGRIQDSTTLGARLESAIPPGASRAALLAELARDNASSLAQARALARELPS